MFVVKRKSTMDKLLYDIHVKREEMIHLGLTNGFNSLETIQVSQELDTLIVKYQRYKENKLSKWFLMIKTSFFKIAHNEKSNAFWTTFIK
ncbi:aspartyl-phosphate phosphatase Spo0E family protein [Bacillus multifaciens]|uniref:aspartyl-phosphate phosphatase Spo0E family protein n=1 Tax=Bacillus multifaciens TaxID=3068506 RepID=UPI00274205B1|nr:aspartyl-phosphate phosphatase Spo0E family protein [Bacillus sp. WLY-B-L8]MDP7979349.1 aspartyl-phosphate phosphatase Spo0E family protein [Bacillus sp. WLY-B-L8]HDX9588115.1 aspartyl-phosphate phosphatase Spo0E family protein [Bacillus pseudomycoides]